MPYNITLILLNFIKNTYLMQGINAVYCLEAYSNYSLKNVH
jgi:hypothetical protein